MLWSQGAFNHMDAQLVYRDKTWVCHSWPSVETKDKSFNVNIQYIQYQYLQSIVLRQMLGNIKEVMSVNYYLLHYFFPTTEIFLSQRTTLPTYIEAVHNPHTWIP